MAKNDKDKKQLEILRFIYETVQQHGFPPTVREICSAVGLSSTSTVHGHISRLQRKGFLIKDATKPRAIEVTDEGRQAIGISPSRIPILGTISTAEAISSLDDLDSSEYFPLPPNLQEDNGDLCILTIAKNDMIKAGILPGDQVIVRKQDTAQDNDIVIAIADNTVTIRRFYKEDGHYRLQAENDSLQPLILTEVTILGKVIGLYRGNIS